MSKKKLFDKSWYSWTAIILVAIYYVMGIIAIVCQDIGVSVIRKNFELGSAVYNIWRTLSPLVVLFIPLIFGLPYLIFCIFAMIKRRKVLPYLICIFAPILIWLFSTATAIAYF